MPRRRHLEHPDLADVSLTDFLFALSDPTRMALVEQLLVEETLTPGQVGADVTPQTLSWHLEVLRRGGIIRQARDGNRRPMTLRRDEVEKRFPGVLMPILELARTEEKL